MTTCRRAPAVTLAIIVSCASCGDTTGPGTVPGEPGISVVAGANATDTVQAIQVQSLRIQVRGNDGLPARNTLVRVATVIRQLEHRYAAEMEVARLDEESFAAVSVDTTNGNGVVDFRVRYGRAAGPGRLTVSVPTLGMEDTATYTVLPGAAASLESAPSDTAVTIGRSMSLRASVVDRFGNRRGEPITYNSIGSAGTVSNGVVSGAAFGMLRVVAQSGTFSDTSVVAVVPEGTIAAYTRAHSTGQAVTLYVFDLDGGNFRPVRESVMGDGYFGDMPVDWLSRDVLIYHDNNRNHTKQLYVHDMGDGTSRRFLPVPSQMDMENYPRVSHDRTWVYFSGGLFSTYVVYRARPDGSDVERISPDDAYVQLAAAPSPDGTQVALVVEGPFGGYFIEVIDLDTREARPLVTGEWPRWSPDGSSIAYVASSLSIVNADGTNARALSTSPYQEDIDWSPDGRYIVGSVNGAIAIVEVATGTEVLVRLSGVTGTLRSPAWRPEP